MPDIRSTMPGRIARAKQSLGAGKIAFQVHRAARLLDSAAWLEGNRAGEHDFSLWRRAKRNNRSALTRRFKQSCLQRALLFANPPDFVYLVAARWRKAAHLEDRSALGTAESNGTRSRRSRGESHETNHSCVGIEARKSQIGGMGDFGLKRRESVAGGIEVALDLDDARVERCDFI